MSEIITALDIGTNNIKGLVVEYKKDKTFYVLNAFEMPSAGLRRAVLVDKEELINVLREVTVELKSISKKTFQNVFVNINGDFISLINSRGGTVLGRSDQKIQEDDILKALEAAKAIRLQNNFKILDALPYEYIVDDIGGINNPLGMYANRLEVNALIIQIFEPHLKSILEVMKKIGLKVSFLGYNPLVAEKSVLTKKQKELGAVLIDFGGSTTSFIVFYENKIIQAKTLKAGGNDVTSDIAVGFQIPFELAENLKINYGWAMSKEVSQKEKINLGELDKNYNFEISKRFLAEIIESRLEEILELFNNEFKKNGRNLKLAGGAVIIGGMSKLKGLEDLVRYNLRLNTLIGVSHLENFEINNPIYENLLIDPSFTVVTGLVLAGVENIFELKEENFLTKFFKNFVP